MLQRMASFMKKIIALTSVFYRILGVLLINEQQLFDQYILSFDMQNVQLTISEPTTCLKDG